MVREARNQSALGILRQDQAGYDRLDRLRFDANFLKAFYVLRGTMKPAPITSKRADRKVRQQTDTGAGSTVSLSKSRWVHECSRTAAVAGLR